MIELDLPTIKKYLIEILDYVIDVCKTNGLNVSLDSGTLIGAIRHKGFIPWDDDIDVTMPRKDYNQLIEILKKGKSRYALFCADTVDGYFYPFAKVVDTRTVLFEQGFEGIDGYGIYIDIFPQDDLPNDEKACIAFQRKVQKLRSRVYLAVYKNVSLKTLFTHPRYYLRCFVSGLLGWEKTLSKLNKYVQKYNSDDAFFCEQLVSTSNTYRKGKKQFFSNYIEVEFEGKKYPAISEYDKYLRNIYGDYMQLPPVEKRISNHNYKAYLKE